jgi:hypothetical protein
VFASQTPPKWELALIPPAQILDSCNLLPTLFSQSDGLSNGKIACRKTSDKFPSGSEIAKKIFQQITSGF